MPWEISWGIYFDGDPIPQRCYNGKKQAAAQQGSEAEDEDLNEVPKETVFGSSSTAFKRLPKVYQDLVELPVELHHLQHLEQLTHGEAGTWFKLVGS